MSAFAVAVTNNHATPVPYDLPGVEAVRFTQVNPGGCGVFSCRLATEFGEALAVPPYLGFDYRVDVWADGRCVWSGLMDPPELVFEAGGGYHWEVSASGWGVLLNAQVDATQNVRNQATSTVVTNALANLVPEFAGSGFASSITATGFTLANSADINLTFLTGVAQIAWAARFGNSADARQVWTVYPDDDSTIRFAFAAEASTPAYAMQLADAAGARLGGNRHSYANRATVRYNGGASSVSANNTTLQGAGPAGVNHIHELLVILDELTDSADATQAADAYLAAHSALRLAPNGPITLGFDTVITDANQDRIEPWRLKAGNVLLFSDVLATEQTLSNLAFWPRLLIAEVDVDEEAQMVTIVPESFDTYMESQVAKVHTLLLGRHTL